MQLLKRIERNEKLFGYLLAVLFLLINNTINASSEILEGIRLGKYAQEYWKPISWEATSALSTIILLPLLFRWFSTYPPKFNGVHEFLFRHLGFSLVFSGLHILIMVQMRKMIYFANEQTYLFGNIYREFIYEYRKDLWAYIIFLTGFHLTAFCYSRLKGEAKAIGDAHQENDEANENFAPKHFVIKKLDSEFLINSEDIEWMESSGNYVNLHVNGRIFPTRSTLSKITNLLESIGMCRVHRSFAINCYQVDSVKYDKNGDGIVQLKSGAQVKLSRTFNTQFKDKLSQLDKNR